MKTSSNPLNHAISFMPLLRLSGLKLTVKWALRIGSTRQQSGARYNNTFNDLWVDKVDR